MLADQVGLGKTIQLAMAALLMALEDPQGGPILVLAPKPLLQQWRDELWSSSSCRRPSGTAAAGWMRTMSSTLRRGEVAQQVPRRIGLVSQGLIVRGCRTRSASC